MSTIKLHKTFARATKSPRQPLGTPLMEILLAVKLYVLRVGATHHLSNVQAIAIAYVIPDAGCTMSELSCALGCDASNATGIVDGLESKGLIERRAKSGDRRVKMLHLEPAGVAIRNDILTKTEAYIEQEILTGLDATQVAQLSIIITKITQHGLAGTK